MVLEQHYFRSMRGSYPHIKPNVKKEVKDEIEGIFVSGRIDLDSHGG